MKNRTILLWGCRLVAAGILLQTLWFKFTAAPESVFIFSRLHLGAPGRIGVGVIELIVAVMILIPRTTIIGAYLALVIMTGAVFSHLFVLGVVVNNDGGLLFGLAIVVAIALVGIIWLNLNASIFFDVITPASGHVLDDLVDLLIKMNDKDFTMPMAVLSEATIGEHVRHCIEMYICVLNGYDNSLIDYNARKRDNKISACVNNAIENLIWVIGESARQNKALWLADDNGDDYRTSFKREILYCNEHAVHHMALIRIAIQQLGTYQLTHTFGVAPSTLKYRQACVQ